MPTTQPVRASGSHEMRRPQPIPPRIKQALLAMVYGREGDAEPVPLDFIEAAAVAGIRANILRRWLHKPSVVLFLRRERAAFRAAICASNEFFLRKVRNTSENGMAVIGAVRGLEDLSEREITSSRGTQQTPGIVINIVPAQSEPKTIEHVEPLPELDP
jgi:hypothetical protein